MQSLLEDRMIEEYASRDWKMLNTNRGGGLGTIQKTKWIKEAVLKDALRYNSKKAWAVNSRKAYETAKQCGWFGECTEHMKDLRALNSIKYTDDDLINSAMQFETLTKWRRSNESAYQIAYRRCLLNRIRCFKTTGRLAGAVRWCSNVRMLRS